jgi:transcriptional regulator with PAS, ATPase and Fis domain
MMTRALINIALALTLTAGEITKSAITLFYFDFGTLPAVMAVGIMTSGLALDQGIDCLSMIWLALGRTDVVKTVGHNNNKFNALTRAGVMDHFKTIIGHSPALDALIRSARIAAATDVTLLLNGETGTGKEILAQAIQKSSSRAKKPFITLNCAALPESLIESELFGHRKGSFTGATGNTQGLIKAADGGTLFLDEINSLPVSIQAKLLRFIEVGECFNVGNSEPYTVDVRIIAASNSDLISQIAEGKFRRDLYYRLNVVPLYLPPLAERLGDIEVLVKHFMNKFEQEHAIPAPQFSIRAIKMLKGYHWPGNIRELRNLCERLCILLAGNIIEPENLPLEFLASAQTACLPPFRLPSTGLDLEDLEASLIHQALGLTKGNCSKSARLLGLTRDTLLYRMNKHGFAPR